MMRHGRKWLLAPILIGLLLVSCQKVEEAAEEGESEHATVEAIPGTDSNAVKLSEEAAHRLDIKTGEIRMAPVAPRRGIGAVAQRLVIPADAVLYDAEGGAWAYTNPEELTYVLKRISIEYVAGDLAVLAEGPPAGTSVVVQGETELYGIEFGLGSGEE